MLKYLHEILDLLHDFMSEAHDADDRLPGRGTSRERVDMARDRRDPPATRRLPPK